jgi:hypothetical protein
MFDPETPNALIPSASKSVNVDDAFIKVTSVSPTALVLPKSPA